MRLPIACAALLLSAALLQGQAPGHFVARVSDDAAIRPAEASIAINPANIDHIVAVSLQAMKPGSPVRISNYSYASIDGGRTWRTVPAPNEHQRVHGDDAVTIARDGIVYHSYIAFDGIRVPRPDRASSGIYVRTSRDGMSWNDPVPVVDHVNTAIPFEDKPWIGVDDGEESPHRGNVYVAWTRFDVYGSADPDHKTHIWFSRSRDGARTFAPPVQVSESPGDAIDSDGTVEGVVPSVGVKGEVYLAWAGPAGLVFDRSLDGGYTFGADKAITTTPGGWDLPVPGITRHNGMPVTAVDHSRGPHRGTIYINWIDERNDDPDVFVVSSRDQGETWSPPVRVNDDPKGNKRPQLFTWMAVDPSDGSVNVVFLDRRDTEGTHNAVTLARSTDGGKTFANHRVNRPPFPSNDKLFYGDYLGIDAHGGRVAVIYPVVVDEPAQLVLETAVFQFRDAGTR
ncbi:MAG: sialidase family protein [Vicinamibacterales bacterium]